MSRIDCNVDVNRIFFVWDKVAQTKLSPFLCPNQLSAIRMIKDQLSKAKDNFIRSNPQDFVLYTVDIFDDDSMEYLQVMEMTEILAGVEEGISDE